MTEQTVDRRALLKGAAAVPLAAALADPALAAAVASGLETVSLDLPSGRSVSGALALPKAGTGPAVMLIHEWWGLNDQIKTVAAEFAKEGYVALAIDLYGGAVAETPERARELTQTVVPEEGIETVTGWAGWLRDHERGTGTLGTVGWCFGGGWSLQTAISTPVDACVVYYGSVARKAEDLAALEGPVLGHFATNDRWINKAMVDGFEAEMDKAGKAYTTHWYEADHAFANPTSARYDEEDAKLAWQRTMAFYAQHLKA